MSERTGVLFVCMGNICRSPVARCIFEHLVEARGVADSYFIDSCGTGGWHEGHGADPRSIAIAAKYGLNLRHTARQIRPESDFERFSLLLVMDQQNSRELQRLRAPRERVRLLRSFDPELAGKSEPVLEVPDPYYGGDAGFEAMYHMLDAACRGLLEHCEAARR